MSRNSSAGLAVLVLGTLLTQNARPAPDSRKAAAGMLAMIDRAGRPAGVCPLKHTDVKADISGFIARVTVTQEFLNPASEKIEAVYTFPLPHSAAIDDMTMTIGDRTIKGSFATVAAPPEPVLQKTQVREIDGINQIPRLGVWGRVSLWS